MTKMWVDIPGGYNYGFPKIYDSDESPDINKWLVDNGCPESIIDQYNKEVPCRFSLIKDEEASEYYKQLYYKY